MTETWVDEATIMRDILVAVSAVPGVLAWRSNSGVGRTASGNLMRSNVPGCCDLTACVRGRFVGIEVKTPIGRQSAQQRRFQAAVELAGGIYVLARSVDDALAAVRAIAA